MAQVKVPSGLLEKIAMSSPVLAELLAYPVWIDYDREADVLYLSFEKPQDATDGLMLEDGILLRYRGEKLVGITILEASKR
ncbi:MAG: DUF2283 domain-containing protein [Candidatus Bipolaricaulia bacterium]